MVILAVVIVLALVAVGVLGGYISIGRETSVEKSRAYWKSQPIGILDWMVRDDGYSKFMLRNNMDVAVSLTSFKVEGSELITTPVYLPIGGKSTLEGAVGTGHDEYNLNVTYEYDRA